MVLRNGDGTKAPLVLSSNLRRLDKHEQECQAREASTTNCQSHHAFFYRGLTSKQIYIAFILDWALNFSLFIT